MRSSLALISIMDVHRKCNLADELQQEQQLTDSDAPHHCKRHIANAPSQGKRY